MNTEWLKGFYGSRKSETHQESQEWFEISKAISQNMSLKIVWMTKVKNSSSRSMGLLFTLGSQNWAVMGDESCSMSIVLRVRGRDKGGRAVNRKLKATPLGECNWIPCTRETLTYMTCWLCTLRCLSRLSFVWLMYYFTSWSDFKYAGKVKIRGKNICMPI